MIEKRGSTVDYYDPLVPEVPMTPDHPNLAGKKAVSLDPETIAGYNAVLVTTDHDDVNYPLVVEHAQLVVDTRNIIGTLGLDAENVVKS